MKLNHTDTTNLHIFLML